MNLHINLNTAHDDQTDLVLLCEKDAFLSTIRPYCKEEQEFDYVQAQQKLGKEIVVLNHFTRKIYVVFPADKKSESSQHENLRLCGSKISTLLKDDKREKVQLKNVDEHSKTNALLQVVEGLALSFYEYEVFKKKQKEVQHFQIQVLNSADNQQCGQLNNLVKAVFVARDLVNEPASHLNATTFSEKLRLMGKEAGFVVEVFEKAKIESLKMGGILGVNRGSEIPPTFNVLEYKPDNAQNKQPIILVGKGVTYDTGGLSLKQTLHSMDWMKADMGGAATVAAALYVAALNRLPLHIIVLIPATDNRIDATSISPGDVITMYDSTTVEVLNTDAEGRLVLADALTYAKKYNPELVMDFATLTGAVVRALNKEAAGLMGTADENTKNKLKKASETVFERLVEFPLWDEYAEYLKSDIADLTNIGISEGGHISAAKFLEHFTDYPWLHVDIAGTAFLTAQDGYRPKGATAYGVRLLYEFLKNY